MSDSSVDFGLAPRGLSYHLGNSDLAEPYIYITRFFGGFLLYTCIRSKYMYMYLSMFRCAMYVEHELV